MRSLRSLAGGGVLVCWAYSLRPFLHKLRLDRYRCLPQHGGQEGSVEAVSDFGARRRLKTAKAI